MRKQRNWTRIAVLVVLAVTSLGFVPSASASHPDRAVDEAGLAGAALCAQSAVDRTAQRSSAGERAEDASYTVSLTNAGATSSEGPGPHQVAVLPPGDANASSGAVADLCPAATDD